ncbi:MAG: M55 family metallopeptidase [Defluviitaleaceae bacterium]|nr:M55 family metallopeptidase [Defluviitaleaceae bacterium]MCL2240233.1 M55 family metallopeptidase [Defluviitaleaceae bacterium]
MKIFISADIEGITTTTTWGEVYPVPPLHAKQMTDEVLACIAGAKKAGAQEFLVKDAHADANTIDPTRMPPGVTLIRNWSGHPYSMAEGVDSTFHAAMFIGYHSAAGRMGNPMSHTASSRRIHTIKINGAPASEFLFYSWACALEGVPTVFLSGDKMLCADSANLHPRLITCPVKDGIGAATLNYSTEETLQNITALSEKALTQSLSGALAKLPDHFVMEIDYKEHIFANKASWFPGVTRKNDTTITFSSDDFFEVLRTLKWLTSV